MLIKEDFCNTIASIGEEISEEELNKVFVIVDTNKDGKINCE